MEKMQHRASALQWQVRAAAVKSPELEVTRKPISDPFVGVLDQAPPTKSHKDFTHFKPPPFFLNIYICSYVCV